MAPLTTPELEAGNAFDEQSPARDALQQNLDGSLTLNRKRSGWFGSAREALSRSAGQAKGYVDSIRGGKSVNLDDDPDSPTENPSRDIEKQGFSPRNAISTLRQHVTMNGSRSRQKRGALTDICTNVAPDDCAYGLEKSMSQVEDVSDNGPTRGHSKRLSLGRNIAGSLRGIKAGLTRSPPTKNSDENASPNSAAPSSPMSTPNAPALTLNLGGEEGLVPKDFGRGTELTKKEEIATLTKPTFAFKLPVESHEDTQAVIQGDASAIKQAVTPTPVNSPEMRTVEDSPCEVFERSVDKAKENKPLKRMISLDAMAEECHQTVEKALRPKGVESRTPGRCSLRNVSAATTVLPSPSDMEELSRQPARTQTPSVVLDSMNKGSWKPDDPFAPGMPSIKIHGPEVELPFRPKLHPLETGAEKSATVANLTKSDGPVPQKPDQTTPIAAPTKEEQECPNSAKKHREMVAKVLNIVGKERQIDSPAILDSGNEDDVVSSTFSRFQITTCSRAYHLDLHKSPVQGLNHGLSNLLLSGPSGSPKEVNDASDADRVPLASIAEHATPTKSISSMKTECSSNDDALQEAILENYELQVAMGGVEITFHEPQEPDHTAEEDRVVEGNPGDISPATAREFEAAIDEIGSDDSSESKIDSVLESRKKDVVLENRKDEDSLDEALDMYRTYSATEEGTPKRAQVLLGAVTAVASSPTDDVVASSPTDSVGSASGIKRATPSRYRLKGDRHA